MQCICFDVFLKVCICSSVLGKHLSGGVEVRFVVVSNFFVECVNWVMSLKICDLDFVKIANCSLEYWKMCGYMHAGEDAHVHLSTEINMMN